MKLDLEQVKDIIKTKGVSYKDESGKTPLELLVFCENMCAETINLIREILKQGNIPPEDMMRKEVSETILEFDEPFVK